MIRLAQVCEKCGKKVGMFSNDPLAIGKERVLCWECAEIIRDDINSLYYIKNEADFQFIQNTIMQKCQEMFNEDIKSADKGGNAIIGVDFDYITFHGNMIGVVANGTSVIIEKVEN